MFCLAHSCVLPKCLLIKRMCLCGQVVQSHLRKSLVPGAHHSWGRDVIHLLTCSSSWKLSFPLCLHSCLLIVPAEYVFCSCFVCMLLGIESRVRTHVRWVPYHQYPSPVLSFSFYVWDKVSLKFSRMALNLWPYPPEELGFPACATTPALSHLLMTP